MRNKPTWEILSETVAILVLFIPALFISSYTFYKLWNWFIVPIGLNSILWNQAAGILFLISFITFKPPKEKEVDYEEVCANLFQYIFASTVIWLFGWIVTMF